MKDHTIEYLNSSSMYRQLMSKKSRQIRQMDREIIKNWQHLERSRQIYKPIENPQTKRRIKTEVIQTLIPRINSNPRKIRSIRAELTRQKTNERRKKNEQIFYKKKTIDNYQFFNEDKSIKTKRNKEENNNRIFKSNKKVLSQNKSKGAFKEDIPFMLRKRTLKTQKQMNIIEHNYECRLMKLKKKDDLKTSLNLQQQMSLINSMKGSKLYYQFVRDMKIPSDQIN